MVQSSSRNPESSLGESPVGPVIRLAVFSDIHGNKHALSAVLESIAAQSPDHIVCLGDLVGYGAFPDEVVDMVRTAEIPTVAGNYDDGVGSDRDHCGCAYTRAEDVVLGDRSLRWTQAQVGADGKAWLRALPREIRLELGGRRVLCVHGSPRRLNEYLYEDRPDRSLRRMFETAKADVIVCGHTHLPYHRRLGDFHLINAGTAGRPREGDPRVTYTLIELAEDVTATFPRVSYEYEAAAQAIEGTDLPHQFAAHLRHGRH